MFKFKLFAIASISYLTIESLSAIDRYNPSNPMEPPVEIHTVQLADIVSVDDSIVVSSSVENPAQPSRGFAKIWGFLKSPLACMRSNSTENDMPIEDINIQAIINQYGPEIQNRIDPLVKKYGPEILPLVKRYGADIVSYIEQSFTGFDEGNVKSEIETQVLSSSSDHAISKKAVNKAVVGSSPAVKKDIKGLLKQYGPMVIDMAKEHGPEVVSAVGKLISNKKQV